MSNFNNPNYAVSDEQNNANVASVITNSPCSPCGGNNQVSRVEQAILNANNPIQINENEEIDVNGVHGVWANKSETAGVRDLEKYRLNNDSNPQIVKKKPGCCVEYTQEVAVKYLKPPEPPKPGDIIIRQEPDVLAPPAPPLVVRQLAERPATPPQLIVRESPPKPPCPIPEKVITIPGKVIPPPPRKVVIEKLPTPPPKPQAVLIERWLPYEEPKRRVIFEKPCQQPQPLCPPRNVIIEWETPCVDIKREYKNLGVFPADPEEYRQKYSFNKQFNELPSVVYDIPVPQNIQLASSSSSVNSNPCASSNCYVPKLEGDIHALRLIDLDREGLSEYRSQLGF